MTGVQTCALPIFIEAVMELNGEHAEALKEIDTFMFDCDGKFYKVI